MNIKFTLPSRRGVPPPAFTPEPLCEPHVRPHRLARVLALAHRLDGLVRSGDVSDHRELARLGHISPARICQYMTLLHLAPAIQEYLLFLAAGEASPISESGLRRMAREPLWDRQRLVFGSLFRSGPNQARTPAHPSQSRRISAIATDRSGSSAS
jgi:hypothetical protein